MKETELKPYDDYEKIKKQADQYIEHIFLGTAFYEHHGQTTKPTIFMSNDILAVLVRGSERAVCVNHQFQTVCGCKVEIVPGTEKLYIGFNLL